MRDAVRVGSRETVISAVEKPLRVFLRCRTVKAGKGRDIELEAYAETVQLLVVFMVHVLVTAGVGEDRIQSCRLYVVQFPFEIHGRSEVACLHQQLVAGQLQQRGTLKAELAVHHVFRRETECQRSVVREALETLPQVLGSVGHLLHDMWREPYLSHSLTVHHVKEFQRVFHLLHPVIYAREQMAVAVGESVEQCGVGYSCRGSEEKHSRRFSAKVSKNIDICKCRALKKVYVFKKDVFMFLESQGLLGIFQP